MFGLLKQVLWKTERIKEMHDHHHNHFYNNDNNITFFKMGRMVFLVLLFEIV